MVRPDWTELRNINSDDGNSVPTRASTFATSCSTISAAHVSSEVVHPRWVAVLILHVSQEPSPCWEADIFRHTEVSPFLSVFGSNERGTDKIYGII